MREFLCAAFFAKKAAGPGFLCFAVRRGGEAAVSPRLSGGVKTPPYGKREHGSSDRRSQQDKIARAACRPPLRPNGNSQFSIFVRNLRKVVGRGLDPAAGTSRQTRRFQNKPPGFPIDVGAACTPPGNVVVARNVAGHANLHGGVRPRPTENGNTAAARRGAVFSTSFPGFVENHRLFSSLFFLPSLQKKDRRNPLRSFLFSCYSSILPKAKSSPSWICSVTLGA